MNMPNYPVPSPTPLNQDSDLEARLNAMVEARLSQVESKYKKQVEDLTSALKNAQRGAPMTSIPFNSGGPGERVAEVWSQYHQELANAGKLTADHLALVNGETRAENVS